MAKMGDWKSPTCSDAACVEVMKLPTGDRWFRTSRYKSTIVPILYEEWKTFLNAVKAGEFDE